MCDIILFGGTTEGRELADWLCENKVPSIVCVASAYGADMVNITSSLVTMRIGRLDEGAMLSLFLAERPRLIIDATHPYAAEVTENIRRACEKLGLLRIRVLRGAQCAEGCAFATDMPELISMLNAREGRIFSSLGYKEARALCAVKSFESRVILRILPQPQALANCLAAGFSAANIICMQGPFSRELNRAMFKSSDASILITKDSGANGGFEEKLLAARELGMEVIVLKRPMDESGCTLQEAITRIGELIK